ncbi:acyltransferase domain-containing protein [Streptomyces sp. LE64]|uniref:acyltransferase domain-containing protein n=1 Tax=Streptomyces sp. LE64 TaxID=3448653 RepID=UPI0040416498
MAAPRGGGVLRDLHHRYESVREALSRIDEAARELQLPAISLRLTGRTEASDRRGPEVQYLEIFAVTLATHHMLVAEGVEPVAIVGQSIGELWALAAAEHVSVEDAARLAVARSRALTLQGWSGKMLAIGVDGRRAETLAGLVDDPHLVLACENAPRQSVVSGPEPLIARVERVADAFGWSHLRLDVPHPTHTPAMAQGARLLRADAPRVPYGGGRWRVRSPWLGRDIGDEDPVDLVAGALTARVRMLHTIRELHAAGADVFVECGEWPVVTKFVEASVPGVRCLVPLSESDPCAAVRALAADSTAEGPHPPRAPEQRKSVRPPAPPRPAPVAHDTASSRAAEPRTVTIPAPVTLAPSSRRAPGPVTTFGPATAAPPSPAPAASGAAGLDHETVLAELRSIYGDFLGYPPDLLGEDDGLESELGVESLKQVVLLKRVSERYELPDLIKNTSLLTSGTLGRIARAVTDSWAEAAGR